MRWSPQIAKSIDTTFPVSGQPQRKLAWPCHMPVDEIPDMVGNCFAFYVATGLDFLSDFVRHIVGPMLEGVEGHHAECVIELAGQEIRDDSLEVAPLHFGFAIDAAPAAAIDHDIGGLIRPVGHNPRCPL